MGTLSKDHAVLLLSLSCGDLGLRRFVETRRHGEFLDLHHAGAMAPGTSLGRLHPVQSRKTMSRRPATRTLTYFLRQPLRPGRSIVAKRSARPILKPFIRQRLISWTTMATAASISARGLTYDQGSFGFLSRFAIAPSQSRLGLDEKARRRVVDSPDADIRREGSVALIRR